LKTPRKTGDTLEDTTDEGEKLEDTKEEGGEA
jgi:hypothetical protein